jgi:hypothetical protein
MASRIVDGEVVMTKTTKDDTHMPIREKPTQSAEVMKRARCPKCFELIDGADYIEALDKTWHKDCFICAECSCQFVGGKFTAENGKPYCSSDWAKLFGSKCTKCGGCASVSLLQSPLSSSNSIFRLLFNVLTHFTRQSLTP